MSEAFLTALMNLVAKIGINAAITFLENRGATIDDAIAALKLAESKRLEEYIAEDAAKRVLSPDPILPKPPDDAPAPPLA